jgi:integrase
MTEVDSTSPVPPGKPAKPRPDFPLFPHATRRWAKKIRGKLHYFGPWEDPDGAEKKYLDQRDDLHAGRKPRPDTSAATVKGIVNDFLNAKRALVHSGELSPRTWMDYKQVCDLVVRQFGKGRLAGDVGPDDFAGLRNEAAKRWGPHRLGKAVQFVRVLFRHAYDAGLIDRPARFGPGFKRPSMKTLRLQRAKQGAKLFTAEEIRRMVDGAGVPLRAMILLGINCGFGNSDCGNLPLSAVDLEAGWIDYPRPKTGIARRCPLWPETVQALKDALAARPVPKQPEHAGLFFVTRKGGSWFKRGQEKADGSGFEGGEENPVKNETAKLLRRLGINGRKGRGFYTLRHTFRTVADETKDQVAVDYVMGHEIPNMSAAYRETISDERLQAVANHVHGWLFPPQTAAGAAGGEEARQNAGE